MTPREACTFSGLTPSSLSSCSYFGLQWHSAIVSKPAAYVANTRNSPAPSAAARAWPAPCVWVCQQGCRTHRSCTYIQGLHHARESEPLRGDMKRICCRDAWEGIHELLASCMVNDGGYPCKKALHIAQLLSGIDVHMCMHRQSGRIGGGRHTPVFPVDECHEPTPLPQNLHEAAGRCIIPSVLLQVGRQLLDAR